MATRLYHFRRQVLWVSTQRKAAAVVVLACKTDVHKLQMAGLRDHNGARAQAPVDDVAVVQMLQPQDHTCCYKHGTELIKRPACKKHVQRAQPHTCQHPCHGTAVLEGLEHARDEERWLHGADQGACTQQQRLPSFVHHIRNAGEPHRVDLLRFPMLHQHESRAVGAKDEALSHQIFQSKAVTRPQHARVLQSQLMLVHDQLRLPRSPCVYESLQGCTQGLLKHLAADCVHHHSPACMCAGSSSPRRCQQCSLPKVLPASHAKDLLGLLKHVLAIPARRAYHFPRLDHKKVLPILALLDDELAVFKGGLLHGLCKHAQLCASKAPQHLHLLERAHQRCHIAAICRAHSLLQACLEIAPVQRPQHTVRPSDDGGGTGAPVQQRQLPKVGQTAAGREGGLCRLVGMHQEGRMTRLLLQVDIKDAGLHDVKMVPRPSLADDQLPGLDGHLLECLENYCLLAIAEAPKQEAGGSGSFKGEANVGTSSQHLLLHATGFATPITGASVPSL
mmetsp:Transcript_17841/g.49846  ORF Transcript_17841/g.49846 Transcript_17841/m.49846 type:complete len:505 (-) Transcript_17841:1808-3322(-)